jgi:hypothetical protein
VALTEHVRSRQRARRVADVGAQIVERHGELLRRLAQ